MTLISSASLYFFVFLLAAIPFFEVIAVVPIAILSGMPAIPVAILGFLGNALTVLLLVLAVDRFKIWRKKQRNEPKKTKRTERAARIWNQYGMPGLAIIGPLFVGSHLTALMGISLGGKKRLVTGWMIASLAIWTSAAALAAHFGFSFLPDHDGVLSTYFQQGGSE